MKVVVFQHEWILQIHTINLLNGLISSGFDVYFICFNCDSTYISFNRIDQRIKVVKIEKFLAKYKRKLNTLSYILFKRFIFFNKINRDIILLTLNILNKYDLKSNLFFIGIEKKGFIWASKMLNKLDSKLIYYSLELYETPEFYEKTEFEYLRKLEKDAFSQVDLLIIQDPLRYKEICRYNEFEISINKVFFLPISVDRNDNFIKKNKSLQFDFIKILYFGKIASHRFAEELCSISSSLPFNFKIHLHGNCTNIYKKYLLDKYSNSNLEISNSLINDDDIYQFINDSTIGLCLYRNDNLNDRLTAFSSEKLAIYLSLGIPIISFNNVSYENLYSKFKCGIAIDNIINLESAVNIILKNYDFFSSQAFIAYEEYFCFSNNFQKFKLLDIWKN